MDFLNNWEKYRKLIDLKWGVIFYLLFLVFLAMSAETFGLALFYPIFEFINSDGDISKLTQSSKIWEYLSELLEIFGLSISLQILLTFSFSLFLFRQLIVFYKNIFNTKLAKTLEFNLANKFFKHYLESKVEFYDRMPIGTLTNIINRELTAATSAIMLPIEFISTGIMLIGLLVLLFFISFDMTVIAIIVLIIASFVPRKWIKKSTSTGRELVDFHSRFNNFLLDRFASPKLIKVSDANNKEEKTFSTLAERQKDLFVTSSVLTAKTELVLEPFVIAISFLFLYFAVTLFELPIISIGLYLIVTLRLLPVIKTLILSWQNLKTSLGSIEISYRNFNEIVKNKECDSGEIVFDMGSPEIKLENIYYKYPLSKNMTLKNITITIPKNKLTAIVGPSGSGKSTLVDLIPKLRIPNSGKIIFNETQSQDIETTSLRQNISYVSQFSNIFDGTIADHIRYGNDSITDDEIIEKLELVGLKEFLASLKDGIYTNIGKQGIGISGGQAQRLDIARAISKNPAILILDEPNSNLDIDSEINFKNVLKAIIAKEKSTIIIIAHRIYSIVDADLIMVMKNGEIIEYGSHAELLSNKNWYCSAFEKNNLSEK